MHPNPVRRPIIIEKLKVKVDTILGWTVILVMGLLVINVLWQVFTRFILRDPSSFTEELARYLLIWVGLLGAAYAAGQRMHLALGILPAKLKGRNRRALHLFIEGATFLFAFLVLVVGGARLVWITFILDQTSAALQLPIAFVYLVAPISGLLIMFYAVHSMLTPPRSASLSSISE